MNYKYIFDLDDTLMGTSKLNNISYNYALRKKGLLPITMDNRITREIIYQYYPMLHNDAVGELIELKQGFFIENLHHTIENKLLFRILKEQKSEDCILWTSAEEIRIKEILEYYSIYNNFKTVLCSTKINIKQDMEIICNILNCKLEELIVERQPFFRQIYSEQEYTF